MKTILQPIRFPFFFFTVKIQSFFSSLSITFIIIFGHFQNMSILFYVKIGTLFLFKNCINLIHPSLCAESVDWRKSFFVFFVLVRENCNNYNPIFSLIISLYQNSELIDFFLNQFVHLVTMQNLKYETTIMYYLSDTINST